MAIDPKININENQVIFTRGNAGHKHDGLTSALIDYTRYSLSDFVVYPLASPGSPRRNMEERNLESLRTFVVDAIEDRVLNPRGIRLQANVITANEISAGTITANELSANLVLINNIIRSSNYVPNTTGWSINSNGYAEFGNAVLRGTIFANAGNIGNILISNSAIYTSDYDGTNGFALYSNGFADFNEVSVRGEIIATSGYIGNVTISGDSIYSNNYSLSGNATVGYTVDGFALFSDGSVRFGSVIIGNNLNIGNTVRINAPTGDGGATVLKVKGDKNATEAGANTTWSFRTQNRANTNHFGVRNDGQIYMAEINSDTGTTLVLNASGYVQKSSGSTLEIKENIEYIESPVFDLIKQLKPVKFTYKRSKNDNDYSYALKQMNKEIGFIVEDIANVESFFDGSLIFYEFNNDEYRKSIEGRDAFTLEEDFNHIKPAMYKERAILSVTVKAVQDLIAKVEEIEARLQALEDV